MREENDRGRSSALKPFFVPSQHGSVERNGFLKSSLDRWGSFSLRVVFAFLFESQTKEPFRTLFVIQMRTIGVIVERVKYLLFKKLRTDSFFLLQHL